MAAIPVRNQLRAVATGSLQNTTDPGIILAVDGYNAFGIKLTSAAAWTGTVAFLGSMDDGQTFDIPLVMSPFGASVADASTATGNGNWEKEAGTLTHVKVVASTAITGGPVNVRIVATNGLKRIKVTGSAQSPLPVSGPAPPSSITPSQQLKIATDGTAVNAASATVQNGVTVKAHTNNAAQNYSSTPTFTGVVGASNAITTLYDGTGQGYPLGPGEVISLAVANLNAVWVNGKAGDIFYVIGT